MEIEKNKSDIAPRPKFEVIDANSFLDADRTSLQENDFVPKIRAFNPNSFSFVICHSYVSKLKIQLEKTGLFSNLRLERNLVKATNGRLISLDDQQKAILLSVAESDNIKNKSVVIQGPEGSGKTLLGLEVAKMMINYHFNHPSKMSGISSK